MTHYDSLIKILIGITYCARDAKRQWNLILIGQNFEGEKWGPLRRCGIGFRVRKESFDHKRVPSNHKISDLSDWGSRWICPQIAHRILTPNVLYGTHTTWSMVTTQQTQQTKTTANHLRGEAPIGLLGNSYSPRHFPFCSAITQESGILYVTRT